jgi:N-methylhydantoinase B/oxoprolinase/acetone carboxylase alpha subunit
LFGGGPGLSGGIYIKKRGDDRFRTFSEAFGTVSDSKFTRIIVREGDEIMINSAGGGGYGDPRLRPPELVAHDVAQGFLSPAAAAAQYGYGEAGHG